jgi:hypothetical protein
MGVQRIEIVRCGFSCTMGGQSIFLTASPAVLVVTEAVATCDHCQSSSCEQLRARCRDSLPVNVAWMAATDRNKYFDAEESRLTATTVA